MPEETLVADTVNPAENAVETEQPAEKKPKTTFTRNELNKYIAIETEKARKAEREKVLAEIQAEKDEAARLAAMTEAERQKDLLQKATNRAEMAEKKLNAYMLKEQTIADNKDLPIDLLNLIDFDETNTAEKVLDKVNTIRSVYNASLEKGVNSALKEKAPKTVSPNETHKINSLADALADRFPNLKR